MEILDLVKQIQIVTPRPGDILVISINEDESESTAQYIAKHMEKLLDERNIKGVSAVIYRGDMKVEIIRKEE